MSDHKRMPDAIMWWQKAAELGDPKAQSRLGNLYSDGFIIEKNGSLAAKYYQMAAEQGDAEAREVLATITAEKKGVK